MKKKTNFIKVILHNDREVLLNLDKFVYATPVIAESTDQELLKVMFDDGREIDIIDKLHEFNEKVMSATN